MERELSHGSRGIEAEAEVEVERREVHACDEGRPVLDGPFGHADRDAPKRREFCFKLGLYGSVDLFQ